MFGSKVLPEPPPGFTYFKAKISPPHIFYISQPLTNIHTIFVRPEKIQVIYNLLPRVNFTWPLMQFSTDVMKNSFSELKLILAKKCHLFGGDKNQGLSHLKGNVNP